MSYKVCRGFDPARRAEAAALYWQAFGGKLGRVMGPEARAVAYVAQVMRPDHAFAALAADGTVIGVAGFRSPYGSFVGGGSADLRGAYGWAGGTLRAGLLAMLARDIDNDRFLVDGLCVRADCRGQGIGRALLEALCNEGRARGYAQARLDVVGGNVRARALYERVGFVAAGQTCSRVTGVLFGFQTVTIMVRPL